MGNKNKTIIFECVDDKYTLNFYIAIKSKVIVSLLKNTSLDHKNPIPVPLYMKHLRYFEFLIYNGFYPPTSDEFLFKMVEEPTEYPKANLDDQIVMVEAFEYLDIKNGGGFEFISDITFEGSFYSDIDRLWVDIKQFFVKKKRDIYSSKDVLKSLKEFKDNSDDLKNFIVISDKRSTCVVCKKKEEHVLHRCVECTNYVCERPDCKYGDLCFLCDACERILSV